jgi:hypothetical protein
MLRSKVLPSLIDLARILDNCKRYLRTDRNINWYDVVFLANNHLLSPTLYCVLSSNNCLSRAPGSLVDVLEASHLFCSQRNNLLRTYLVDTIRILNSLDVVPILLKGSAALLEAGSVFSNSRLMGDLDILVPRKRYEELYRYFYSSSMHSVGTLENLWRIHHGHAVWNNTQEVYFELHHQPLNYNVKFNPCYENISSTAHVQDLDGARFIIPSIEFRLVHACAHHYLQDGALFRYNRRSIRSFFDFYYLRSAYHPTIDWHEIFHAAEGDSSLYAAITQQFLDCNYFFGLPMQSGLIVSPKAESCFQGYIRYLSIPYYKYIMRIMWRIKDSRFRGARAYFQRLLSICSPL